MPNTSITLTYALTDENFFNILGILPSAGDAYKTESSSYKEVNINAAFKTGELKLVDNKTKEQEWRFPDYQAYDKIIYISISKGSKEDRLNQAQAFQEKLEQYAVLISKKELEDA